MTYTSRFTIADDDYAPWISALWQGSAPAGVTVHCYLHLDDAPDAHRRMLIVWDATDEGGRDAMEQAFADFGTLETQTARDATAGLAAALARDLDAFGALLAKRGLPEDAVAREVELRRRGLAAPTREAAIAEGRSWADGAP